MSEEKKNIKVHSESYVPNSFHHFPNKFLGSVPLKSIH